MQSVIFIPGTLGTILKTPGGEEVWPPTPLETQFGYNRSAELVRPDVTAGGIIGSVMCFPVYDPILSQLRRIGYSETGAKRLVLHPYDWRQDLEKLADEFALRLDRMVADGATEIIIVAHSMGGLISRLALESGKHDAKAGVKKVTMLVTVGTPHLGAPLALARIMGLDSTLGVSGADFRKLASDRRYPSGYQLLPPPGEVICWDIRKGDPRPLDIYDAAVAAGLGLDMQLLGRAKWVHGILSRYKRPEHIRYFYFAGTGHRTVTRLNIGAQVVLTRSENGGDGTVPLWSALPTLGQKQLVPGEHASFFSEEIFQQIFFPLLGAPFPKPPVAAAPVVALSVQSLVIGIKDRVEVLLVPPVPAPVIEGEIVLERTDRPETAFVPFEQPTPLSWSGPPTPQLKLELPPPGEAGFYRIRFHGKPGSSPSVNFAVSEG